ncbi:hypothetical protein A2cp1_1293 [Anaeromyxobacter dehalogenans 2CP-1]|uniref:Uncharacterized protein n=1 Tax=Anaeromyxobacter dehalogenans (strain ATCC BAA-258 / DSM 21875 / 2CP-1) TaxID=455488 RepID=B8JGG6_ANAD2|nr:hypothetical protein A2cp1_1293 [Anaeromyxobacter dehalogenans 2CP-1]
MVDGRTDEGADTDHIEGAVLALLDESRSKGWDLFPFWMLLEDPERKCEEVRA